MKIPFFRSSKNEDHLILGIDIGGSGIKGAIVDTQKGELVTERVRIDTPQPATPEAMVKAIADMVNDFKWEGKIGCGFPAVMHRGVAKTAANVDNAWIGTNIETLIKDKTGLQATVINDADAAGLAEIRFGVGKGKEGVILLLTIGTGIGSALFNNGVFVPNTEFGHLYYKDVVAEKYCSDSARKKYELEWEVWAERFSKYLKHLERILSPDVFILGGGVSKKPEKFLHLLNVETEVLIARLENNAGIVGAACAAT